jgi:multiple sugar transport system permease protein
VFVVVLFAFTAAFLFPMLWLLVGAMKSAPELARVPPTVLPNAWHPQAYVEAWQFMELAKYFLNTVIVAVGAWLLQLAVGVPAAYALSKLRPRLGNVIFALMLATLMVPAAALLVPTYMTISDVPLIHVNLVNSPTAIWLPAAASAFNIYLLKRFFDQIPDELLDAARIDGAGPITTSRRGRTSSGRCWFFPTRGSRRSASPCSGSPRTHPSTCCWPGWYWPACRWWAPS